MFGLHGRLAALPGQRDALLAILTENGPASMPGCRLYMVSVAEGDDEGVWVTEAWDDEASHKASLEIPAVREAIGRAMPLLDMSGMRQQRLEPRAGVPE